jgi:flagellar export protein FliJ
MAFKFGLEPVLKHRERLEEIAHMEYTQARAKVDAAMDGLETMCSLITEIRAEIASALKSGSLLIAHEMEDFLAGHKIRIDRLRQQARELLRQAEDKQDVLIKAARERKVLAILKDRKLAEYRDWLRRIEAKALDDQTMTRQVWGKR